MEKKPTNCHAMNEKKIMCTITKTYDIKFFLNKTDSNLNGNEYENY